MPIPTIARCCDDSVLVLLLAAATTGAVCQRARLQRQQFGDYAVERKDDILAGFNPHLQTLIHMLEGWRREVKNCNVAPLKLLHVVLPRRGVDGHARRDQPA